VHNIPDFEVFAAAIPKIMGAKVILDIHDIVPELFDSKFHLGGESNICKILKKVEKISMAFADHVIVSNAIWQKKITTRSVDFKRCTALINYPDNKIFYERNKENGCGKEIFLYPGSLNYHQGLDIAIRAFAMVKEQLPNIDFHIYGDGPAVPMLRNIIREKRLEERVILKREVEIEKIADIMRSAKCGIVPKRAESFGNEAFSTKIMEFMALGVPVIAASTAIDRFYFNDSLLLFFESGNESDLSEKMLSINRDAELRTTIVKNAGIFIKDNCWNKKKQIYLELVESLVD
jgi:glycosyltransferase involved in cell wall biosynthesis